MGHLFSSSIGKKLLMSVTGLFLLFFLLFHATMNLVAIFSPEGYNAVCKFLGANWYALAATLVLAGGFVVHIFMSIVITLGNRKSRGNQRYAKVTRPKEVSWASKNMFVLGVIVVGFIGLHLYQFWAKMQLVEIMHGHGWQAAGMLDPTDGMYFIQYYFSQLWVVICYIVWLGALWFHLNHGFWSALQTIGWNNQTWLPRLQTIGKWFSTIVVLMFIAVVVIFYVRSLCCGGAC
ncbi:MAG: succinate dehydrogenase cytochrome b subunit [Rikenellaceae bacterium]